MEIKFLPRAEEDLELLEANREQTHHEAHFCAVG